MSTESQINTLVLQRRPIYAYHTMGTLSDITAQATNNIRRRSPSTIGYQVLQSPAGMDKENHSKSRSPHFMTPTFSSSKQSVSANGRSDASTSTPMSTKPVKGDGNNAWMKTAAKRVGFHRNGDGTPRSKKEAFAKPKKAISFPDKVQYNLLELTR